MNRFVQFHLLTSYPPSNLNRDDLNRPKTAVMGGAQRLRVSSQSLKRAWRTSELFKEALDGHVGTRTKEMGRRVFERLVQGGAKDDKALKWAQSIAGVFGALVSLSDSDAKKLAQNLAKKGWDEAMIDKEIKLVSTDIRQLAHFGPEEERAIEDLCDALVARGSEPTKRELALLRKEHSAADIALFGRMLADAPAFRVEAAAQVAHAITVHKVAVEDDFFTAVDDLNAGDEDLGAGHMGETEFAAGLFYQYICVDRAQLVNNLSNDAELAKRALGALAEAAATVAPGGKQNSFGSRARASYIHCEVGNQQPRSLSVAFLKPVEGPDMLGAAIQALEETVAQMDRAYGSCADRRSVMNTLSGKGTLRDVLACASE